MNKKILISFILLCSCHEPTVKNTIAPQNPEAEFVTLEQMVLNLKNQKKINIEECQFNQQFDETDLTSRSFECGNMPVNVYFPHKTNEYFSLDDLYKRDYLKIMGRVFYFDSLYCSYWNTPSIFEEYAQAIDVTTIYRLNEMNRSYLFILGVDVFVNGSDQLANIYVFETTNTKPVFKGITSWAYHYDFIPIGDWDNDGKIDIPSYYPNSDTIYYYSIGSEKLTKNDNLFLKVEYKNDSLGFHIPMINLEKSKYKR